MTPQTARKIADTLTWARVWGAVPATLLAWYGLQTWFVVVYVAMALTDLFDGMFARRATPAPPDRDFDGLADLLFSIMTLVWLWMLVPGFYARYMIVYLPVLIAIEIYHVSVRLRYPGLPVPHFEFGRRAMVLFCFLLPVLLVFGDQPIFVHLVFVIGTLSKLQLALYFYRNAAPEHMRKQAA